MQRRFTPNLSGNKETGAIYLVGRRCDKPPKALLFHFFLFPGCHPPPDVQEMYLEAGKQGTLALCIGRPWPEKYFGPSPWGFEPERGGVGGGAKSSSYGFRVGRRKRAATRGAWQVKDLLIPVGGMCSVVIQPRRTIRLVWLDGRFQVKADPA